MSQVSCARVNAINSPYTHLCLKMCIYNIEPEYPLRFPLSYSHLFRSRPSTLRFYTVNENVVIYCYLNAFEKICCIFSRIANILVFSIG